jgi:signal transduction histidine kinase
MPATQTIPQEQAMEIRRLAHDLSNALEIIIQANYLLATSPLDESAKQWAQLLDQGVQQAANINRDLREYVRANS